MKKIVVVYNIPIPKSGSGNIRTSNPKRFPFEKMRKGGSFLVKDRTSHQLSAAALCWAKRWYKSSGKKVEFTVRQTQKGARIWRVK